MPFFGMPLCLTGFFSAAASGIIDLDSRLCGRACFMHRRSAAHERENLKAYKILAAKVLLKPPAAASWYAMSGQRVRAKKYGAMKHALSGIDTMFLSEHERCAKCKLRNMVQ